MQNPPIEDNLSDILRKAIHGLGYTQTKLATKTGVPEGIIAQLTRGEAVPENILTQALQALCPLLSLRAPQCIAIVQNSYYPKPLAVPGLWRCTTAFEDMTVNSFLIWDNTGKAVLFDTGADAGSILTFIFKQNLHLQCIFLTHSHDDHVACLSELVSKTGAPVWVNTLEADKPAGSREFEAGSAFLAGKLQIKTLLTAGHSKGGTTYLIEGLTTSVAIVGDALFAGSIGGGLISFSDALKGVRENIMTLPVDCVLLPGHGPETTVGEEKAHNAFDI